jgi:hypothetical protein
MTKKTELVVHIQAVGFLDWWNTQTIKAQQDWLKRHTDDSNRAAALANQKVRKTAAARKHGVYPGIQLVEGGWGIFVRAYRQGRWVETNENAEPWPTAARALDAARRAALELAQREKLPVRG